MHEQKINILLIDDDELLLRALARTLSRLCANVTVACLQLPNEFERYIENNNTPDIIFCDSMMPLSSGLKVLEHAKAICPTALRCLFTSDLSSNYQLQVNNTIHFHLVKPFTQKHLVAVLDSAKLLKLLPIHAPHRVILGQLSDLPFLGIVTQNLLSELNINEPNISILENNISHDPVLTGKVLQVANSAFMGFDSQTTNLKEAIIRIGLVSLKAIVVFSELSQQLLNKAKQETLNELINKGYKKASMAQSLAKYLKQDRQTQLFAFAVGLLSVIGELAAMCIVQDNEDENVPKYALSAYLLALWGFEKSIVRAQLLDDLPVDEGISLTVIHMIVEHAYCQQVIEFNQTEYDFIDDLKILEDVQQWFLSFKK